MVISDSHVSTLTGGNELVPTYSGGISVNIADDVRETSCGENQLDRVDREPKPCGCSNAGGCFPTILSNAILNMMYIVNFLLIENEQKQRVALFLYGVKWFCRNRIVSFEEGHCVRKNQPNEAANSFDRSSTVLCIDEPVVSYPRRRRISSAQLVP